ncbi:hypothetical protein HYFRA_00000820 [Hymenoscyphus fraxineus]|uniref:Uncharacterized protein n=1 Tax=Hymenoscyphus fraxineus TaxID=746836 RepID=A0A9N9KU64_9HELO|nr:hypothetical protein HYFRA_00000820 [Hymenoscyphus fraxineus]
MATTEEGEKDGKSVGLSKEEYEIITNKIAVAIARHEEVVKGWIAQSARSKEPRKTLEQLQAEDAELFRPQPPRLGIGCPIPAHFLKSDAEIGNTSLRAKLLPSKGLKASKARDAEEKAASAKRGMREQSSDEEEGRSGLGRAKKQKTKVASESSKKGREVAAVADPSAGKGRMRFDEEDSEPAADPGAVEDLKLKQLDQEPDEAIEIPGESQLTKKQKKKKKKKKSKLSAAGISEREPQGIPILPSRSIPGSLPRVAPVSTGVAKITIPMADEMEVDTPTNGDMDEAERLRNKELKKELKKQRKKERREKKRSGGGTS